MGKNVVKQELYGNKEISAIWEDLSARDYELIETEGLEIDRVTLQKLFIYLTDNEVK